MNNQIEILKADKSWRERRRAARALRHDSSQEAIEALTEAINDVDDEVAQVAIISLVLANKPDVAHYITRPRFSLSSNSGLRWAVAHALSKFGNKSHFEFLLRMSSDTDWMVRDEVFSALDFILSSLMMELESGNKECVDENIHLLVRMLQVRQKGVRQKIYSILVKAFKKLPLDLLLETLGSDNVLVETGVINVLGMLGQRNIVPHLAKYAASPSILIRLEVIKNVSILGGPEALIVLINRLGDGEERVTRAAKDALHTQKNEPYFTDILIDRLNNVQSVTIRKNIVQVMGRTMNPEFIPSLFVNLGSPFYFIRQAATQALVLCKELVYDRVLDIMNPVPISIAPFLKICKENMHIQARLQGIELIGKSREPHAIKVLEELLSDPSSEITTAAEEAMDSIFRSNWERANCAHILGEIGNADAAPCLLRALTDWSIEVRTEAIGAVRKLRIANSPDELIHAFHIEKDSQIRRELIACLGEVGQVNAQTKPTILSALDDKSQLVRQQAARMLRLLGPQEAVVMLLIKHLDDDSLEVRTACLNSLFALGDSILGDIRKAFAESKKIKVIFHCMNLAGLLGDISLEPQIQNIADQSESPILAQRAKVVLRALKSAHEADREILFTENP